MIVDAHTHRAASRSAVRVLSLAELRLERPLTTPFAVGLHPWDLSQATLQDRTHIQKLASSPSCVAIGETGLDRVRATPWALQLDWLQWHWRLAEELNKPLVLHAVRASSDLLQLLKQRPPQTPWQWHDFSGPQAIIKSVLKLHPQMYFSFSPRGVRRRDFLQLWESVPADRRLLETDDSEWTIQELYQTVQPPEDGLKQNFERLFALTV